MDLSDDKDGMSGEPSFETGAVHSKEELAVVVALPVQSCELAVKVFHFGPAERSLTKLLNVGLAPFNSELL